MQVRWVPPDRVLHAVRDALRLGIGVKIVECPIEDLPQDHPWRQEHYMQVHPDGLVEVWRLDECGIHVLEDWVRKPDVSCVSSLEATRAVAFPLLQAA